MMGKMMKIILKYLKYQINRLPFPRKICIFAAFFNVKYKQKKLKIFYEEISLFCAVVKL